MADPALYEKRGESVSLLRGDLERAEAEAARLTSRWEELEERKAATDSTLT